ncbi:MAG: ATPase [Armatimonadetes bacterium]|nr:ATPase [Armatimonadota bacterium]
MNDRWYRHDKAPAEAQSPDAHRVDVICPGCKQVQDHNPGGVLTLSGQFLIEHNEEIMNLIQHEDEKARGVNPLEKIMEMNKDGEDTLVITTTNEFLVQRLGKAVHRAYNGDIEIKFGGDDVPVRVNWHRD